MMPPVKLSEIDNEWIESHAEAAFRWGHPIRANGATIEVKSQRDNTWLVMALPGGRTHFETPADAAEVVEILQRMASTLVKA